MNYDPFKPPAVGDLVITTNIDEDQHAGIVTFVHEGRYSVRWLGPITHVYTKQELLCAYVRANGTVGT